MPDEDDATEEMVPSLTAVAVAVRDFMHASRELTNRIARAEGRGATDVTALGLLDMLGPLSPTELAAHLGVRTASATALVDRLEQAGAVRREAHGTDRRRVVVHLEEESRARGRETWTPVVTGIDDAARALSPAEQAVVIGYLQRVTGVLARHPEPPPPG